jgi:Flp pilus assembly protein TadG
MIDLLRCTRIVRNLREFGADQDGVSAVEFAMLLPLMITLYLGSVEITQAVSADRKMTLVANTAGDLLAQASSATVSSSDISVIFNAAKAVGYPLDTTKMKVVVTSVYIDSSLKATVPSGSSCALNGGTTHSGTVTSSIPSALLVAGPLIWAEAYYTYTPTVGQVITSKLTLSDKIFLRPRTLSGSISFASCPS